MKVSPPLATVHVTAALLLALTGMGLLFAPDAVLALVHGDGAVLPVSSMLSRQIGLGLLLAAAVNLVCLAGGPTRVPLQVAVLIYLAGLLISHGRLAFGNGGWLWLLVLAYALPLLPWAKLARGKAALGTSPLARADGRQHGEVKWFNPKKGFGFILADNGNEVFVHFKAIRDGGRRGLRAGMRVSFVIRHSERGEQADQVEILP